MQTIPSNDVAWLHSALSDALAGGEAVLPTPSELLTDAGTGATRDLSALRSLTPGDDLPADTALVIRTSGSTGVPKSVALSAAALRASAEATHEAFGGPGQWLICLPLHLISGAQMLVRSIVAGTQPVCMGEGSFTAAAFLDAAQQMTGERRYVSLVPVQLQRLLDAFDGGDAPAGDGDKGVNGAELQRVLQRFDAVLVGGGPTTVELRQRAYDAGIALRRSYGSSETAGGCVYDGSPIGSTRVRLRDGEVQISGPTLAYGYLGDPDQTAQRFFVEDGVRWYRTGDAGTMFGGVLQLTGRLDRVLISGGVNVSLDEIERVVRDIPGWSEAVAVPVDSEHWGQRPVLVASLGADAASVIDVQRAVREEIGAVAVPDRAFMIDEIPRLPGGKPDYVALAQFAREGMKNA